MRVLNTPYFGMGFLSRATNADIEKFMKKHGMEELNHKGSHRTWGRRGKNPHHSLTVQLVEPHNGHDRHIAKPFLKQIWQRLVTLLEDTVPKNDIDDFFKPLYGH